MPDISLGTGAPIQEPSREQLLAIADRADDLRTSIRRYTLLAAGKPHGHEEFESYLAIARAQVWLLRLVRAYDRPKVERYAGWPLEVQEAIRWIRRSLLQVDEAMGWTEAHREGHQLGHYFGKGPNHSGKGTAWRDIILTQVKVIVVCRYFDTDVFRFPVIDDLVSTQLAEATTLIRRACDRADAGADGRKKKSKILPENDDVTRLANLLIRELPKGERSRNKIAEDYKPISNVKVTSLLRKMRDYPDLMSLVNRADPRKKIAIRADTSFLRAVFAQ